MTYVKRNRERLHKKGNIVVFPGTIDRLLDQAEDAIEAQEFEEAVHFCEQLIELGQNLPGIPGILSVAFYETKEFERAKPYAAEWLQNDAGDYFEAMELYLAICMQLQDYEEVEDIIGALLDENVIPPDLNQKFNYLRELNGRLSNRYTEKLDPTIAEKVSFKAFLEMDPYARQQVLAKLERNGAIEAQELLVKIATYETLPALLRTVAIVLLRGTGFDKSLTIRKFGRELEVIPSELHLPSEDKVTQEVCTLLEEALEKDPSRFALLEEAVKKFAVISYPLGWGATPETIAEAYENYSFFLFEGTTLPETALHELILAVDQGSIDEVE